MKARMNKENIIGSPQMREKRCIDKGGECHLSTLGALVRRDAVETTHRIEEEVRTLHKNDYVKRQSNDDLWKVFKSKEGGNEIPHTRGEKRQKEGDTSTRTYIHTYIHVQTHPETYEHNLQNLTCSHTWTQWGIQGRHTSKLHNNIKQKELRSETHTSSER